MRTQIQRLAALLRKKDKQIHHVLNLRVAGSGEGAGAEGAVESRIRQLKSEMASISALTQKVREYVCLPRKG